MLNKQELKPGTCLRTKFGIWLRVVRELGAGGNATSYEVELDGCGIKAMKWYRLSELHADHRLVANCKSMCLSGPPSKHFIWPIDIVDEVSDLFGCVMDLLPEDFECAEDLYANPGRFPSYKRIIDACIQIVSCFHAVHCKGYCFQDIPMWDLFVDPQKGGVIFSRGENVAPEGTYTDVMASGRYAAPEIVTGASVPSMRSDRYSMAVIVFMLLCHLHPLEGARFCEGRIPDDSERRRAYGLGPVFVFDSDDSSNRPDSAILASCTWESLPRHMRDFFCRAFSRDALLDPRRRPSELEWMRELVRFRSEVVSCKCWDEVFLDGASAVRCGRCGALCGAPLRLEVGGFDARDPCVSIGDAPTHGARESSVALVTDARLYRSQLNRSCSPDYMLEPQLWAVSKKGGSQCAYDVRLCNVSRESWKVRFGREVANVAPGQSVRAIEGLELEILGELVRVCANV